MFLRAASACGVRDQSKIQHELSFGRRCLFAFEHGLDFSSSNVAEERENVMRRGPARPASHLLNDS